MNKWTRIIATSTASVALAGTALLGATGSASAAPRPTGQDRQTVTVSSTAWDRTADRAGNDDRRWNDEITPRHYDYGHHRWNDEITRHHYSHHRVQYWSHGRWVTVWLSHGHGPVR
ncbi:hypothetical protein ABZ468_50285 [Streptomyces sp. NPDC005708]|uniref:hypothetical protein n=1 Tax=Streptomyces sp. NPDC005708 TaxID=3154564 RepID=UPI0033F38649